MNSKNNLQYKKVIISTHVYATGPSHSLENYLSNKTEKLLFIGHPFVYAKDTRSYLNLYKNGSLVKTVYFPKVSKNQFLSQIKDSLLNIFLVAKNGRFDLFVGVDSSNATIGIILKKMGLVKTVIYYTIDYVPKRFNNQLINSFYHQMDGFSVKHSDYVWNLSSVMVGEREKRGISHEYRLKQLVVPIGTDTVKIDSSIKTQKHHVAHMGHLLKKQGVQLVIDAIPIIIKKVPAFHLEIIGGGEYEDNLKAQVKKMKIDKYVTFHGFIKNHKDVEKLLMKCEFGVAPYTDEVDNYVRYTDPGKVKAYLAVGLPVVITKVPDVYRYLENHKCGIAVEYKKEALAQAIVTLLLDRKKLELYKKNALLAAKEFSWEKIFSKAFIESK